MLSMKVFIALSAIILQAWRLCRTKTRSRAPQHEARSSITIHSTKAAPHLRILRAR